MNEALANVAVPYSALSPFMLELLRENATPIQRISSAVNFRTAVEEGGPVIGTRNSTIRPHPPTQLPQQKSQAFERW